MKTKYMLNWGLAFTEKRGIKNLQKMAAKGWLLKGFTFGGFLFKLEQGPAQELVYTFDFESAPDEDYFDIFNSAGWKLITSYKKEIHIFSAPKGTAPIYSGNEFSEGKYHDITSKLGKGAWYSLLALIVFLLLSLLSKQYFEVLYYPIYILFLLSLTAFVFCFMPYVSYKFQAKKNE